MRRIIAITIALAACDTEDRCMDFVGSPEQLAVIPDMIRATYPEDTPPWVDAPAKLDALLFYVPIGLQDKTCEQSSMDDVVTHMVLWLYDNRPAFNAVNCAVVDADRLGCCAWSDDVGAIRIETNSYPENPWIESACGLEGSAYI